MGLRGKKIVISGGGSGGHITPLVYVAQYLQSNNQMLWLGDTTLLAQQSAARLGIDYVTIPAAKFHRFFTLENLRIPSVVFSGIRAAKAAMTQFKPDVVFAKGGYASLPVVMAAADLRIPVVIHESDAVMGLANRMATRYASRICTVFPKETYPFLPAEKFIQTGIPIAPIFFSVRPDKIMKDPRLLVTGGSQGARDINQAIRQALPQLLQKWEVDHIVGAADFSTYRDMAQPTYRVYDFVDQAVLAQLIANAAVVVGRASATTFTEVVSVGRPMIVIPLPLGANGHQYRNAQLWTAAHAAVTLDQSAAATPDVLVAAIESASERVDPAAWQQFVRPKAVQAITRVLEEASQ